MEILILLVVGLVAGILASKVVGGIGYGLVGDIVVGVLGAFFGSWLFRAIGAGSVLPGIAGSIFVAFIGAVVLLGIVRLVMSATRGGRRHRHHHVT